MSRHVLRDIADQYQRSLKEWSEKRDIPVIEAPQGRRDDFVVPISEGQTPIVVIVLEAREPARIMTAIATVTNEAARICRSPTAGWSNIILSRRPAVGADFRPRLSLSPVSARVCLDEHHWLANRMREEGVSSSNGPMPSSDAPNPSVFLKLFERVYAPLTAGLLSPVPLRSPSRQTKAIATQSPL